MGTETLPVEGHCFRIKGSESKFINIDFSTSHQCAVRLAVLQE